MASEETVDYDEEKKAKQIDMVPIEEKEPLTGSSVLIDQEGEAKELPELPDNGFPAGYGPNEHIKKPEPPKKPSSKERMRRSIAKMTKKQKIITISVTVLTILAATGIGVFLGISGAFRIDYSGTYEAAKELRTEMQRIKSNASCDKVIDYVDNAYTNAQVYGTYVDDCREVGKGVTTDVITVLGRTEGVLKDNEIFRKYETFRLAMESASTGNKNVQAVLDSYVIWHKWIITKHGIEARTTKWTEEEIESTAAILTESKEEKFIEYGEKWAELKLAAMKAQTAFDKAVDPSSNTDAETMRTLLDEQKKTAEEYKTWEEENAFVITKEIPFEMVDMAVVYNKFTELYDLIRETYQNNYNRDKGGCKNLVDGSVVCD